MTPSQLYLHIAVWSQVASSIVFIAILVVMWFRWLLPVFLSAQDRSNRQIAEAERHREDVKAALEALHAEIETARHDAELIVARASDHAEHERQSALREASEAGERAVLDAGKEIDRARAAARRRLREELVDRALRLARRDAAQRVGESLDLRLIDRFVGSLESGTRG